MKGTFTMLKNIKPSYYKPMFLKTSSSAIDFLASYGKFIRNNPNASKKERQKAIKLFLDTTRK